MMSTIKPRFEITESPVNVRSPHSWSLPMPIVCKRGFGIPSPPIGPNHRASFDILHKKFTNRLLIGVCSGGQADTARPLYVLSSLVSICNHFNSPRQPVASATLAAGAGNVFVNAY